MDRIGFSLVVTMFFVLACLVSPAAAIVSDSVNETALTVWSSAETEDVYAFEPVEFYAKYVNTTNNTPIDGAICRFSHNLNGNWRNMSYSSQEGTYKVSEEFVYPGFYQFRVNCSHLNFEELELADEFIVYSPPGRTCGVDVYGLNVEGSKIIAHIKNTGNWKELVSYTIYVNDNEASSEEKVLEAGKIWDLEVEHNFEPSYSEYRIRIEVNTDCTAEDSEEMGHWHYTTYTCSNPPGVEGQNRCDPTSQKVLVCRNGEWVDSGLDYCYNCPSPYEPEYKCQSGWTGNYRCDNGNVQREYKHRNCVTEWVTIKECEKGCYNGVCRDWAEEEMCGVEITSLDFESNIMDNGPGRATLVVKNTGHQTEEIELITYIDGNEHSVQEFELAEGESKTKIVHYSSSAGAHSLKFKAITDCGKTDFKSTSFNVYRTVRMSFIESEPQAEYLETKAGFSPEKLDIPLGRSGVIRVSLQTSEPQVFTLDVRGVPEDWISYNREMRVDRKKTSYIYITPKETGTYTLELEALALDENQKFSSQVKLFVAQPQEESQDEFSQEVRAVFAELFAQPETVYVIIAAFLVIAVLAGFSHLKEPEIWEE